MVHAYTSMYNLDTIIIRPGGVFGRGFYVGGSTVGMVMRDLALAMIKGDPITIDAKTYGPNEYVYGKDVGLALCSPAKRNIRGSAFTTPAPARSTAPKN